MNIYPNNPALEIFNKFKISPTLDVAKEYLSYGFDINSQYEKGHSFLTWSCANDLPKIVEFLLKNGANPNIKLKDEETPLHLAASIGDLESANLLIKYGADVNAKNSVGKTPLHSTCYKNFTKIFYLLIDSGADPNLQTESGITSLHFICKYNNIHLLEYLLLKKINIDINLPTSQGFTALHFAAEKSNCEIIDILVDKGINVNAKNDLGETALHMAINYTETKAIHCLLKYNLDLSLKNEDGNTPLNLCLIRFMPEIALLLITKGLNIESIKKSLTLSNDAGDIPLHIAAAYGDLEVIKEMLKFNININVLNSFSKTPLDLAIQNDHTEIMQCLKTYQNYKDLLISTSILNNHTIKKPKI